jgi:hypothetical protein
MLLAFLLSAIVLGPADVESLTAVSDAVVHAQVTGRSSAWAPGGGQIFTTVMLRPIEIWKGDPAREIAVLVPGGEVGDLSQTVQGAASFADGEEVVVFLHRRAPGVFQVERLSLGKFAVRERTRRAVRDRRLISCEGCKPSEADDLPLDELRARVLSRARR